MRTLPASQETARALGYHSVMQIISIAWPDATEYYSTRGTDVFNPDSGKTIKPWVLMPIQLERSLSLDLNSSRPAQTVSFFLAEDPDASPSIREQVADINPVGLEVFLYEVYKPATGSLTSADWITCGCFNITQTQHTTMTAAMPLLLSNVPSEPAYGVLFKAEDFLQFAGEESVGRLITTDIYPDALENLGEMIPLVFGICQDVPALLVDSGARTSLSGTHTETDTTLYCVSTIVLPSAGRVIIDAERIDYTTKNDTINTLTGLTRGANNTTPASHLDGSAVVIEKLYTKFAVCDIATAIITNIKCNRQSIELYDALLPDKPSFTAGLLERPAGSGKYVYEIWLWNFPHVTTQAVATSLLALGQAATPIVMANDSSTSVVTPEYAVDTSGDNAHLTFASLPQGATLKVKQTNNLSAEQSEIKRARVIVEYQVIMQAGETYPTGAKTPSISVYSGTTLVVSVALEKPLDMEGNTSLFPATDPTLNSKALFDFIGGDLGGTPSSLTPTYRTGYRLEDIILSSHPPGRHAYLRSWPGFVNVSAGDALDFSGGNEYQSFGMSGYGEDGTSGDFVIAFGNSYTPNIITIKPLDDFGGTEFKRVTVTFRVRGIGQFWHWWSDLYATLTVGGIQKTISQTDMLPGYVYTLSLAVESATNFTKEQVLNATFTLRGGSSTVIPGEFTPDFKVLEANARFALENLEILAYAGGSFLGNNVPLEADTAIPSSRVTQKLDITDAVRTAKGWPWFDGTGATPPKVRVTFPSNAGNETLIRVFNIDFELEVLGHTTSLINEDTVEITCDVMGIVNPATNNLSGIEAIHKVLTGSTVTGGAQVAPTFFGFNPSSTDKYDYASLVSSIASATASWTIAWAIALRVTKRTTLNDLLAELCFAAGIRYTLDSGRVRFVPTVIADFGTSVMTIDKSLMQNTPERTRTPPSLVTNALTCYYAQRYTGTKGFSALVERANLDSQSQGWGIRSASIDVPTIQAALVANRLTEIVVGDFSWSRSLFDFSLYGCQASHLEVGDVVALDNNLAIPAISSIIGRVVRMHTGVSPDLLAVRVAVDDSYIRVWEHAASGSFIDVYPAWGRTLVTLDETAVAEFSRRGLRIKGILIEAGWDTPVGMTNLIERSTGPVNLRFGVNTTGNQNPAADSIELAMTLDTSGNLRVDLLVESSTYPVALSVAQWTDPGLPGATWWQQQGRIELNHLTNKNDLVFTPDKVTTYALLVEASRALITRRITEHAIP